MKLIFGSDHGGFKLKKEVLEALFRLKSAKDDSELSLFFKDLSLDRNTFTLSYSDIKNMHIEDLGCFNEDSVNYPDYAQNVCLEVLKNSKNLVSSEMDAIAGPLGILVCGSGQGMAMKANKFNNIRAALVWNEDIARLSRQHNNANILCLPGRFITLELALNCLLQFISVRFEGGRHQIRVANINNS